MTADDAQMAADIVLTAPGLAPIHTAIVESRRIFRRLRAYVVYRVALTVQLVIFLCIVSAVYDQSIEPFYVIVLALAHDLTIVEGGAAGNRMVGGHQTGALVETVVEQQVLFPAGQRVAEMGLDFCR